MDAFAALAEPQRRRIIEALRGGERPAGDLVTALGLSQPNVSKHLKALKEARLVSARVDGQRRVYRLEPQALAEVDAWLKPYRRLWSGALDALEQHLEQEQ
jgi:DNA-binding transcriptional ArsR family regulator